MDNSGNGFRGDQDNNNPMAKLDQLLNLMNETQARLVNLERKVEGQPEMRDERSETQSDQHEDNSKTLSLGNKRSCLANELAKDMKRLNPLSLRAPLQEIPPRHG